MDFSRKKSTSGHESEDGAQWIWTAVDAKTRLLVNFLIGDRTTESGRVMIETLVSRLAEGKPLFTSDELACYKTLLFERFHDEVEHPPTGKRGRPRNPEQVVHEDLDYATVHKTREAGQVVKVERKVVFGDAERIQARFDDSPSQTINTSFVERLNATLRQMDAHLRRKSMTFAKALIWLKAKFALIAAWYNLVRPHTTLSRNADRTTTKRTPAMAAGLATAPWTVQDLISRCWVV